MLAYESVDLREPRIVSSQCPIQQFVAIAHLHPHHWPYALLLTFRHEVGSTHGSVDVGQRHRFIAQVHGSFDKLLDGHRAIAQTII